MCWHERYQRDIFVKPVLEYPILMPEHASHLEIVLVRGCTASLVSDPPAFFFGYRGPIYFNIFSLQGFDEGIILRRPL